MNHSITKPKKILFAHSGGRQSGPGEGSFDLVAYLKKELSPEYEVHFPIIENPEAPTYKMWAHLFAAEFKAINEPVILIGHSLGASMLVKYLSEESPAIEISALFLVATPLWDKNGWDIEEFALQENFELQLRHIENVFLYQCKEDDIVPFEHLNFYIKAFPHATVRALDGTDHVFADGLPELVEDIKSLSRG